MSLENGDYGCGVVLAKISRQGKIDTRSFLAGLTDWLGNSLSKLKNINSATVIDQGYAHIKSVTETGCKRPFFHACLESKKRYMVLWIRLGGFN